MSEAMTRPVDGAKLLELADAELSWRIIEELGPWDDFGYKSFKHLSEATGADIYRVRTTIHALRDGGSVVFGTGLMTDEGEPYGSGYALTDRGVETQRALSSLRARALSPQPGDDHDR